MRVRSLAAPGRRTLVRAAAAVLAVALVASVAVLLGRTDGYPVSRLGMSGGGAWLASPSRGLVTLIDGPSETVVGSVRAPGPLGAGFTVVQAGPSAYLVGGDSGTVSRVDGATYAVAPPMRFGAGPVAVLSGGASAYVVDGQRGAASVIDPVSLGVRDVLSLASRPGPEQSVVDDAGRLWVVDRGGVAWFDRSGKHVRPDAGGPDARLLLVAGQPSVVDLARARVAPLSDSDGPLRWSCLDVLAAREPRLLGSTPLGRVVAAAPGTGRLVFAGTGRDDCGRSVAVGRPGDEFGPLVEAGNYVLVPNRTSGRTAVVDVLARRVVADLQVARPGHRLEVLAKDGLVFYNDLDGERAGVLRFDGRQWTVGRAQLKYRPNEPGILVAANQLGPTGAGADRTAPGQPRDRNDRDGRGDGDEGDGQDAAGGPAATRPDPDRPAEPGTGARPPEEGGEQPPPGGPPDEPPPSSLPRPGDGTTVRLTAQVLGAGTITVLAPAPLNAPAGAACGPDSTCDWEFEAGTAVTLGLPEAPAPGVVLDGVAGCGSTASAAGQTTCQLTVDADTTVQATFAAEGTPEPDPVTLTASRTGAGTLTATPAGGAAQSCDPTCVLPVAPGTSVELAATAAGGSFLADWGTAGCAASAATCTVAVVGDQTVTVAFAALIDLTVSSAGTGAGTVTGTGLSCAGSTCTGSYRAGTVVDLAATPAAGSTFGGWSGCTPTGPTTCTLTVSTPTTVTATFTDLADRTAPDPTLTALGQSVGVGTGSRSATLPEGTTENAVATAADGESAVTATEIWVGVDGFCLGPGPERPVHRDSTLRVSSAGPSVSLTLSEAVARQECGGALFGGMTFHLTARAVSEGGVSAFTSTLDVSFPGSAQ